MQELSAGYFHRGLLGKPAIDSMHAFTADATEPGSRAEGKMVVSKEKQQATFLRHWDIRHKRKRYMVSVPH